MLNDLNSRNLRFPSPCLWFYLFIVNVFSLRLQDCCSFILGLAFLCILYQQPPHFDAPVLPLFIFISPSSPFLPVPALGVGVGGLWAAAALSPLPIQYKGKSYIDFGQDSALTGYYTLSLASVDVWKHSLWSSLKFLHSAKRLRWLRSITNEEELWGEPVIKHLPLLMAAHWNSQSSFPVTLSVCQRKKEIQVPHSWFFTVLLFFYSCILFWSSCWDGHRSLCLSDRVCTEGFYSTLIHTEAVFKLLVWSQTEQMLNPKTAPKSGLQSMSIRVNAWLVFFFFFSRYE